MKAPKISEAAFQRTVIDAAKVLGWLVHHQRPAMNRSGKWSSAIQGHAGFPDLVLVHERTGKIIIAELKNETGKISADQGRWLMALSHSAQDRVWRPFEWELIEAELKRP